MNKLFGHMVVNNRNVFRLSVFNFPGRGFHLGELGAHDHLDVFSAEAPRGPAAVHRGITTAKDQNALANFMNVLKGDRAQPLDADVNVFVAGVSARQIKIAAAWGAGTDKDGVIALIQNAFQAVHVGVESRMDPHVEDVVDLFVEDRWR